MAKSRVVFVFIDASNLWEVQKAKGQNLDFVKLRKYLSQRYKTSEISFFYYTAYPGIGTRSYDTSRKHKFYAYLKLELGFTVRKKELKQIPSESSTHDDGMIEKGNMDVELTIDAVHNSKKFDTAILFTGDSDFLALVKFLHARNKKVYIFSSRNNVSSELLTGGDGYTDILHIPEDIWREKLIHRKDK